jgi:hypothetical protein
MYNFYENFSVYTENAQPYSIETEKNARFDHSFGLVKDGRYEINCCGGRHIIKTPALDSFSLDVKMSFMPPLLGVINYGVYFGYDVARREGKLVMLCYNDNNSTLTFSLFDVCGEIKTRISDTTLSNAKFDINGVYHLKLDFESGVCKVDFEGFSTELECGACHGNLALTKYHGSTGLYIYEISLSSNDKIEKTNVFATTVEVPPYDGGDHPRIIELSIDEYEGGLSEITAKLSGDLEFTEPFPSEWRIWTSILEFIKKPYIRFIGDCDKERYYLHNDELKFVDNVNRNSESIGLMNHVEPLATKDSPYTKSYLVRNYASHEYFVFGYENFRVALRDTQADRSEFVFDRDGNLVYYGRPLTDDAVVCVESEKTAIEERIKNTDFVKKDDALFYIRNNHYFEKSENPIFNVRIMHARPTRSVRCEYYLENTYFKTISRIEPVEVATRVNEFGLNEINARLVLDKLEQKIYHLRVKVYFGEELISEHESAFDVIDPALKESPVESSGLPFLHAGDAMLFGAYPWMLKKDSTLSHYFDSIVCAPGEAEDVKSWELLNVYRKKTCLWLTARTVGNEDFFNFREAIKHAHYINLGFPGIEDSPNYYRYDHFHHLLFQAKKLRERYNEFVRLHPEYKLNEANLAEKNIPIEDLFALQPYFDEWVDFANEMVEELFREQWARVLELNPKAKRYSYGPFSVYACESIGAETIKYFGYNYKNLSERFDFMQFEDYVFCCDYPLAYSSWTMATNKILAKGVRFSPELYDSFGIGCPDGHVAYARPPFSDSVAQPYQTTSQIYAYLYNSVYYNEDGFNYYNDKQFMIYTYYNRDVQKRMHTFVDAWGKYLDNKPVRPKKTVCYFYKFDEKDNRFDIENGRLKERGSMERCFFYNKCASAMCYLYEKISEAGMPAGFIANTLSGLSENDIEILVIPSVYAMSSEDIAAVRLLADKGVKLIATGDVTGLEDLFGVEKDEIKSYVNCVYYNGRKENVLPIKTTLSYKENGARVLLSTNANGRGAIFEYCGNVLIGADLCELGAEDFEALESLGGRINVSTLVRESLVSAIKNVFKPVVFAEKECYVNIFESENGSDEIILYDATPFYGSTKTENKITVYLDTDAYTDVESVSDPERKINKLYSDGVLYGFEVTLGIKETLLFKLKK